MEGFHRLKNLFFLLFIFYSFCSFGITPTQKIANLIKENIKQIESKDFYNLMRRHYSRLYLIDENYRWKSSKLDEIKDFLLPENITMEEIEDFLNKIVESAEDNSFLVKFLSLAEGKSFERLQNKVLTEGPDHFPDIVAYALVLEKLTAAQVNDYKILEECSKIWIEERKIHKKDLTIWKLNLFGAAKLKTVEGPINEFIKTHKKVDKNPDHTPDPNHLKGMLPLNIMEAMALDLYHGFKHNVHAAYPLVNNAPGRSKESESLRAGPNRFSDDKKVICYRMPLPKKWADLYSTWNMAFVSQFETFPYFMAKLIIPQVQNYKQNPTEYIYRRALALYTHIHFFYMGDIYNEKNGIELLSWKSKELTTLWGKSNLKSSKEYASAVKKVKKEKKSKRRRPRVLRIKKYSKKN